MTLSANAQQTIGTWAKDIGFPGTTTAISGTGGAAIWSNTGAAGTGNAAIVAPFDPITLNLGDVLTFTGTITFSQTTALGNTQFRFGVFNNTNPVNSMGYKGYMGQVPQVGVGILDATIANGTNWAANAGNTALTTITNANSGTNTTPLGSLSPFTFTLSITYNGIAGNAVAVSFLSSDGTSYMWNATANDAATVAASNATYNEIGFFYPGNPAGGTISFSNVSVAVNAVPEPGTMALLLGAGSFGMLTILGRRRRQS